MVLRIPSGKTKLSDPVPVVLVVVEPFRKLLEFNSVVYHLAHSCCTVIIIHTLIITLFSQPLFKAAQSVGFCWPLGGRTTSFKNKTDLCYKTQYKPVSKLLPINTSSRHSATFLEDLSVHRPLSCYTQSFWPYCYR